MNNRFSFRGMARIRIVSAAIPEILRQINQKGIVLHGITLQDELTAEATVNFRYYDLIEGYIINRGENISIVSRYGLFWYLQALKVRPVLVVGMVIMMLLSLYLPTRILFVFVEGNRGINSEMIRAKAEAVGVYFGASRRNIRSENVKNALMAEIPQLQWVGVMTKGCTATIFVKERESTEQNITEYDYADIYAGMDGVISQIVNYRGNVLCRIGQAVKTGDRLVTGQTDCGSHIVLTPVKAEIYADTLRCISSIFPVERQKREEITCTERKFSIVIGKNIIKLYNDSGISDTRCVKMYEQIKLMLPGGFCLPVAIGVETIISYRSDLASVSAETAERLLSELTEAYLADDMISGCIISDRTDLTTHNGVLRMQGEYHCREMIGQKMYEEISDHYE